MWKNHPNYDNDSSSNKNRCIESVHDMPIEIPLGNNEKYENKQSDIVEI